MDQVLRQRQWAASRRRREPATATPAVTAVALVALVALVGCSGGATSPPTSGQVSQPAGVVASTAASVSPAATAPQSARASTTWSAAAIRILTKATVGSDVVLTVRAPADTTFAVGTATSSPARPCSQTVVSGGAVTYRVVCPLLENDDRLIATITAGAFSYSFLKAV